MWSDTCNLDNFSVLVSAQFEYFLNNRPMSFTSFNAYLIDVGFPRERERGRYNYSQISIAGSYISVYSSNPIGGSGAHLFWKQLDIYIWRGSY